MWQQCLKTTDLRIVDVRVTEKAGKVAKYSALFIVPRSGTVAGRELLV
jgi:hypothetical protein